MAVVRSKDSGDGGNETDGKTVKPFVNRNVAVLLLLSVALLAGCEPQIEPKADTGMPPAAPKMGTQTAG